MMKRLFCLLMALMLLPVAFACAEESDAGVLEMDELAAWAEEIKARAMTLQPLNDPVAPESFSDDGYAFIYEFATLYMDRPEMTEDSVLKNIVITGDGVEGPRGTMVNMFSSEILDAFYNENEALTGDRSFAVLYDIDLLPGSAQWAWVVRDGQRISAIQYAVHDQLAYGGEGYTDTGLLFTIQENLVSAIRAYGLDSVVDTDDVLDNLNTVEELMALNEYKQVPVSYVGTDLEKFGQEDLFFLDTDFLAMTPDTIEDVLGECRETTWMEDGEGYILSMEFENCEVTFICDSEKKNPVIDTMAIFSDKLEGPRSVRIGDTFSSVLTRFRYNEGDYNGVVEVLYGEKGVAPYGLAEYGLDASAVLRYAAQTEDGREVLLYMNFESMSLCEILMIVNH